MYFMFELSMESLSSKYLMWVFILLLVQICGCKGCIEEEKMGLLEFKAFLKVNDEHTDFLLPSWIDNNTSECCNWERVICNPTTGRVKKLSLNDIRQQQNWLEVSWYGYENVKFWLLNVSIFLHFEELHHLNLSGNSFDGFIENEGFKGLSSLKKLEILDISGNEFDKSALKSLSAITSLKTLAICSMGLAGSFPIRELASLRNLEVLDLSYNDLESFQLVQDFASLSNLEMLDLSFNSLSGIIPSSIRLMPHLKSLSLAGNYLNGSLQNQGFCQLNKLQELDLSYNLFQGILPPCLNNFTSLRLLDISANLFSGNLSSPLLPNLTSLEYIDLSYNQFEGSFSFSSFANHSKLQVVILGRDNNIFEEVGRDNNKFEVETEYPVGWVPLFQLKVLSLSSCKLTGDLPGFLQYQFRLVGVDLSHNNLTGSFPNWLLANNTRLEFLVLRNNSLMGQLLPLGPNTRINSLDISHNQLDGQLQENVAHMIPNIMSLNLSNNGFEGILPSSIAELRALSMLDLFTNNFSREVPKQLLAAKDLEILKLSNNKFHGEIFSRDFNLTWLKHLYLGNNQFTGTLSNVICRSSLLRVLDVSNNYMSGEIPSWIGNMTGLGTLVMGNNNFKGKLPPEISQLSGMMFLDISQNALSGSLPSLKSMEYLEHLHLQGNMFTGLIPRDFLNSSNLLTLDIRENRLFGSIPDSISALLRLRILLLGGNLLSGFIPNHLCHLTEISLMDLSNNSFSGPIPKFFGHIRFGEMKKEDNVFGQFIESEYGWNSLAYAGYLVKDLGSPILVYNEKDEVDFVTKNRRDSYKGGILEFMSGLDLSCNNLTGEIPHELGMLSWIRALNLSHNQLNGSIPKSFSNLSQIESLDLSYNKLGGEIPLELVELNFLEVFSVAYNNISGRVPDTKAQFATFDESNYEGNPFLCGELLKRKCNTSIESPCAPSQSFESEAKWYDINHVVFFASFTTSYIIILLGFATILYINPYWRHRWFNFIEECIYSCYYFVSDSLSKLSTYLYN
eukprot:XP_019077860.1 PREDICTED: probable LRR receptor-like serine/threonine-protein kinase At4g36180 isoform X3 [Vitis vinifera]